MSLMPLGLDITRLNFPNPPSYVDENTFSKPGILAASPPKAASSHHPTVIASGVGLIHVLGYTPGEGEQGVPITANINFTCQVGPAVRVRLVVGRRAIATQVRELADQTYGRWQLEGTVPPFARQRTISPKVLLTVQAVNLENTVLDSVTFGEFTYWESDCSCPQPRIGTKRLRSEDNSAENNKPLPPQHPSSPRLSGCGSPTSQGSDRRGSRVQNRSKLHRRSNLTTTHGKGSGSALPDEREHKAVLQILSPLQSLSQGWDTTELQVGRRLVRFKKVLEGYKLQITCEEIDQKDYHDEDIVVSCIYRDEEDSCCITSVDIIYLLERLVDDEFEVEEKNRIRRNLEGFRPTTVSKHKPGFEDFFQRIMDFPDPKPRNIEKDVKVFDWGLLPQALEKIISKYSLCCSPSEDVIPLSVEVPTVTSTTAFLRSSSEHSNSDTGNQGISSSDEAQLSYPSDESFPAVYANPTVVDKYYVPQANDVIPTATSHIVDLYEAVASDLSRSLNGGSDSSSGSWNMDPIKGESPEDLVLFEISQTQEGVDTYRTDGDGLHTYDSLEFQTLREHNLEYSHSSHSL